MVCVCGYSVITPYNVSVKCEIEQIIDYIKKVKVYQISKVSEEFRYFFRPVIHINNLHGSATRNISLLSFIIDTEF